MVFYRLNEGGIHQLGPRAEPVVVIDSKIETLNGWGSEFGGNGEFHLQISDRRRCQVPELRDACDISAHEEFVAPRSAPESFHGRIVDIECEEPVGKQGIR